MHQVITVGSTQKMTLWARKDGAPWALAGATVTLYLRKPTVQGVRGDVLTRLATVTGGSDGSEAVYVTPTTDYDVPGSWERTWRVQQGGIDITYPPISFPVIPAP